ncbi:MAG: diaminopimelate decarboxylase [Gammaproteobacteria bacterium]|nr:diaminopimelate decarboxylase [Gammaproteobacteria bacterium]MDG1952853.1 diaminopimelate decarboxylase [Gammaproteobacteria bacterium]MDG2118777.1 diaminopimelate decarboxylase [Gammaproteobacteria bacterium]
MKHFNYISGELCAEQVPLTEIATKYGTPSFVYSRAALEENYKAYEKSLAGCKSQICFAVKANSNIGVLNVLARLGAGFDIVSGGELTRVIRAGGQPSNVIFSGLGKTVQEIRYALDLQIKCFNVESPAELDRIDKIAGEMDVIAPVSLRINPDIDAGTHPYISTGLRDNKFGIESQKAYEIYKSASALRNINLIGVDCHIGSQITSIAPFLDSIDLMLEIVDNLTESGVNISHLDIGGGLGVRYGSESIPSPEELLSAVMQRFVDRDLTLIVEPGRSIAANAGIFLTRVEYLKFGTEKNFAVVDGAMNDLIRPALYGAWQKIVSVALKSTTPSRSTRFDVVGPICESSDFLGKDRDLMIDEGDLLAVMSAGAYGFVMSSNYNTRPRSPEVLVDDTEVYLVRKREDIDTLLQLEDLPSF